MTLDAKHYVDRERFQAWARGDLLMRDANGVCIVGDSLANESAESALERGETIVLTVGGRPYSTMRDDGDAYKETVL